MQYVTLISTLFEQYCLFAEIPEIKKLMFLAYTIWTFSVIIFDLI